MPHTLIQVGARNTPMAGLREFFQSDKGKMVAFGLVGLGVVAVGISLWIQMSPGAEIQDANNPAYINASTGAVKHFKAEVGFVTPQGWFPAENCYWTKEGKTKEVPTLVLLNKYKGSNDPTFCPDCGRLVVGHNPPAMEGKRPPPTQAEYKPRNAK
jgi:hypothetical protein